MSETDAHPDTRERLLIEAIDLIERQGFCAFSYADLADRVGIRKPSIHHHFPTKADLGVAVVRATRGLVEGLWRDLERDHPRVPDRLRRMFALKRGMAAGEGCARICRVGALQAEFNALPAPVQAELTTLSEAHAARLAAWLDEGRRAGDLVFPGPPRAMAQVVAAAIQAGLQRQRCNPAETLDALLDQLERLLGLG
jgi:TetR/AcrR family transcriptional repressor of nem operon